MRTSEQGTGQPDDSWRELTKAMADLCRRDPARFRTVRFQALFDSSRTRYLPAFSAAILSCSTEGAVPERDRPPAVMAERRA